MYKWLTLSICDSVLNARSIFYAFMIWKDTKNCIQVKDLTNAQCVKGRLVDWMRLIDIERLKEDLLVSEVAMVTAWNTVPLGELLYRQVCRQLYPHRHLNGSWTAVAVQLCHRPFYPSPIRLLLPLQLLTVASIHQQPLCRSYCPSAIHPTMTKMKWIN